MSQQMTQQREETRRTRKRQKGSIDYTVVIIVSILLVFGLIMIYSTSYYTSNLKYGNSTHWVVRQGVFSLMGIVAMLFVAFLDYHIWQRFSFILLCIVDVLIIYATIFGQEINGAKRWVDLGFISFQPSEVAKFVVIISFAKAMEKFSKQLAKLRANALVCGYIAVPFLLIIKENLSTAIILASIVGIMLFVASPKLRWVICIGCLAVVGCVMKILTESFRGRRLKAWRDPAGVKEGYQTLQSLYAIGSGGLKGKGLGQSLQKLGFIPESHNDMIFSIICEEFGFIGAIGVIILFLVLIFRMYCIVINAYDLYGAMIVTGVMAHIGTQVLINVAVVTNTIPNTGVPLPFISYGGTSMLFLLSEIGLVLSVSRTVQREK